MGIVTDMSQTVKVFNDSGSPSSERRRTSGLPEVRHQEFRKSGKPGLRREPRPLTESLEGQPVRHFTLGGSGQGKLVAEAADSVGADPDGVGAAAAGAGVSEAAEA